MGVKTKDFGPYAWVVLEGLGKYYDDLAQQNIDNTKILLKIQNLMTRIMFMVGFVLPCVYCRISYRHFTNPESHDIDIHKMLMLKNGGKRLVYDLHRRVSKKLEDQELEKQPDQAECIKEKWAKYNISFKEANQTRFVSVTCKQFWVAYVVFLGYAMCDYRPQDGHHIFQFMKLVGELLNLGTCFPNIDIISKAYTRGLKYANYMSGKTNTLAKRIDIIWNIQKYVFIVKKWKISHTPASFQSRCAKSIVTECDQTMKNKSGKS
jgi:hypothetical protein